MPAIPKQETFVEAPPEVDEAAARRVFAAIRAKKPNSPPIDDDTRPNVLCLLLGSVIGQLYAKGEVQPDDVIASQKWIGSKVTCQEMIDLIYAPPAEAATTQE